MLLKSYTGVRHFILLLIVVCGSIDGYPVFAFASDVLCKDFALELEIISANNPMGRVVEKTIKDAFIEYRDLSWDKQLFSEPKVNQALLRLFAQLGNLNDKTKPVLGELQKQFKKLSQKERARYEEDYQNELNKFRNELKVRAGKIEILLKEMLELEHPQQWFIYERFIQQHIKEIISQTWALIDVGFGLENTEGLIELFSVKISLDIIFDSIANSPAFYDSSVSRSMLLRLIEMETDNPLLVVSDKLREKTELPLSPEQLGQYKAWFEDNRVIFKKLISNFNDNHIDTYISFAKFMVANTLAVDFLKPENESKRNHLVTAILAKFSRSQSRASDVEVLFRFLVETVLDEKTSEEDIKYSVEYFLEEINRQFP